MFDNYHSNDRSIPETSSTVVVVDIAISRIHTTRGVYHAGIVITTFSGIDVEGFM